MRLFLLLLALLAIANPVLANSGYPVPRFVSLASNEVSVRAGPGKQYPIKWVYQRAGYPVEVVREYDSWRKIRDVEGHSGWVYQGLLSGQRTAVLLSNHDQHDIYRTPDEDGRIIAGFEAGVIVRLNSCEAKWCEITAEGITGWILRESLWGIYEQEQIN